jgi:phospholipid transport system transporter-binding protein
MSNKANIRALAEGTARLSGDLTFATVKDLSLEAKALLGTGNRIGRLDLSEVRRIDSSGLALLLEWQANALKSGASFQLVHAPADLVSLAKLCEAQDLLQLQSRNK